MASGPQRRREIVTVATILERTRDSIIQEWFGRVQADETLMSIPLSREQRCGHLPLIFIDLICRLRSQVPMGTKEPRSAVAARHGVEPLQAGLYRCHVGRRVPDVAGQHLQLPA